MQDYCWDSPASLYTFQETFVITKPFLAWLGIPLEVPRVHPVFKDSLLNLAPKNSGQRSAAELARHVTSFKLPSAYTTKL